MSTQIVLPSKLKIIKEEESKGIYEIEGLYPGYGHTLGNSIRRVILSSVSGSAVTSVKIKGVDHEFSVLSGLKEDIITVLINLKKIRFRLNVDGVKTISLSVKGTKEVTASDIESLGEIEVLTPNQYICEITDKNLNLEIEMTVEKGLGYVSREELSKEKVEVGSIALDAIFTPVRKVNYEVENMRVGDRTDYNRLRIHIETDGTIDAKEVIEESIKIMIEQLATILDLKDFANRKKEINFDEEEIFKKSMDNLLENEDKNDNSNNIKSEILKNRVDGLDFSTRTDNSLLNANIRTLGGLIQKTEKELLYLDGFGQKSLDEVKEVLEKFGLELNK